MLWIGFIEFTWDFKYMLWTVYACHIKTTWWRKAQTRWRPGVDHAADQAKDCLVSGLVCSVVYIWSTLGLLLVCTFVHQLVFIWHAYINALDMSSASLSNNPCCSCTVYFYSHFVKLYLSAFEVDPELCTFEHNVCIGGNMHLTCQTQRANLDSQRAPSNF